MMIAHQLSAQSKLMDNLKVMANYHTGFNLPEYPFFIPAANDFVRAAEISFLKESRGKHIWEQLYNYPEYGLSLQYSSLGNDDILGRELALTYFFKVYYMGDSRFRLFNRIGLGLSYVTKKFDLEDNYWNVAIASHINMHFNLRLGGQYRLNEDFALNAGLSFDHFSNANASEPNLGINSLTGFAGLSYQLGQKTEKIIHEIKPHVRSNDLELFLSVGSKHTRSLSSEYFLTGSLSLHLTRKVYRAFHLGVGVDLFYDSSVKTQLEKRDDEYKSHYDFQSGIHISQTVVFNRFTITIQEGIYIGLTDQLNDYVIYNRGIFQYRINERWAVRLAMKSNLHILDYPELGIGLKL